MATTVDFTPRFRRLANTVPNSKKPATNLMMMMHQKNNCQRSVFSWQIQPQIPKIQNKHYQKKYTTASFVLKLKSKSSATSNHVTVRSRK